MLFGDESNLVMMLGMMVIMVMVVGVVVLELMVMILVVVMIEMMVMIAVVVANDSNLVVIVVEDAVRLPRLEPQSLIIKIVVDVKNHQLMI